MKSDVPAFYARWVTGLRMRDVTVDWAGAVPGYFSDGLRVEEFQDVAIDGYTGRQAQASGGAALSLKHGSGVSITNSRAATGTETFLQMEGVEGRRVFVNYDLNAAARAIVPAGMRFETQIGGRAPATKRVVRQRLAEQPGAGR